MFNTGRLNVVFLVWSVMSVRDSTDMLVIVVVSQATAVLSLPLCCIKLSKALQFSAVKRLLVAMVTGCYGDWLSADCSSNDPSNKFKCVPGRWIVPIGQTLFLLCGIILLMNLLIATFK